MEDVSRWSRLGVCGMSCCRGASVLEMLGNILCLETAC